MELFNADLHIHSPYSIAVSKNINLDTMLQTATLKGLSLLGTGDITQPNWRKYLIENLTYKDGIYSYGSLNFIIQTELEDIDSIHHVVFLPDIHSGEILTEKLKPYTKNIDGRWAGRPHVNKKASELVEIIEDVGGIIGPAHAFTPFKSIFRQGRYRNLKEAYGTAAKKISFIELGLSADTNLADRLSSLQDISFLSNSDAHSEGLQSLGREFNKILMETPSFEELKHALERRKGRKITLNVGLDPRLGKYYIMFCSKCRRRVRYSIDQSLNKNNNLEIIRSNGEKKTTTTTKKQTYKNYLFTMDKFIFNSQKNNITVKDSNDLIPSFDDKFLYYSFSDEKSLSYFLKDVEENNVICKACQYDNKMTTLKMKDKKKHNVNHYKNVKSKAKSKVKKGTKTKPPGKLKLGVSERINAIADWAEPHHPEHRPPYLAIIPLIEILRAMKGIKSLTSKTLHKEYHEIVKNLGTEYRILSELSLEIFDERGYSYLGEIIRAFRNKEIKYTPGGGGTFGSIIIE